jgi:UDP-N-acetylmuramate--alanine ligase
MLPLAILLRAGGAEVAGSDRSFDQGRHPDKLAFLKHQGILIFPQNGSGINHPDQLLVTSAAVEETVMDVQAARQLRAEVLTRPQLLAHLFNGAPVSIGVAGTSGKSTVTAMIALILHEAGLDPTVITGAVMKNFATPELPFASALAGRGGVFVSEVDESDGSIALYRPTVAVLTNISLDHKTIEELRALFGDFVALADAVVINIDDAETRALSSRIDPGTRRITFSLSDPDADLRADCIVEEPLAVSFTLVAGLEMIPVRLQVPGRHNVSNALAAVAGACASSRVSVARAARALADFTGVRRRFEVVGTRKGVSVIDDFAHNPEKIAATLKTLHAFPGRLLVLFQPHGYAPLKVMKEALVAAFGEELSDEDVLVMPDPVYFGGTVDRAVGSADIVAGVAAAGRRAEHVADRAECGARLRAMARRGDRIVVMGARDDSLSVFAREVLEQL